MPDNEEEVIYWKTTESEREVIREHIVDKYLGYLEGDLDSRHSPCAFCKISLKRKYQKNARHVAYMEYIQASEDARRDIAYESSCESCILSNIISCVGPLEGGGIISNDFSNLELFEEYIHRNPDDDSNYTFDLATSNQVIARLQALIAMIQRYTDMDIHIGEFIDGLY
jgi:hypothetical protein